MRDYNFNYYLSGLYQNGGKYFERQESEEEAMAAIDDIAETEQTFIKMGSPKEHAASVVKLIGLQIIKEVDSTYNR